jgi:hypothetical protein
LPERAETVATTVVPTEPPPMPPTECPKLRRTRELIAEEDAAKAQIVRVRRQSAAIGRWRQHQKGTGNHEFFALGASLARAGVSRSDTADTLRNEAVYAHGAKSQNDRRASISAIVGRLSFAA